MLKLFFTLLFASLLFAQKESIVVLPDVPQAPTPVKAITKDSKGNVLTTKSIKEMFEYKKVYFSDRVAPEKYEINMRPKEEVGKPGQVIKSRVSAYLKLPLMDVNTTTTKLQQAGFEILSVFKVDKKGIATSIVFTNKEIQEAASRQSRGFASTLRVVLDNQNKQSKIMNPIYVMRAFMQDEYNKDLAETTLEQIRSVFPDIQDTDETLKFTTLKNYRFMENMPYYTDMKKIAEGNNEELFEKAKKSGNVVYSQHLSNGSIVLGAKLSRRTTKFVKRIGYENASLLPYPVLIEDGKAKILAPQYYIALMYPLLKMSKFMKIATTPGAIEKEIDVMFR